MGVSGSGKSAVASEVAHQLHAAFLDGDFLHPRRNIEKMASGEPLNDDDRKPWLQALNDAAFAMQRTNKVSLIVCSALKKLFHHPDHICSILRSGCFIRRVHGKLRRPDIHRGDAELLGGEVS